MPESPAEQPQPTPPYPTSSPTPPPFPQMPYRPPSGGTPAGYAPSESGPAGMPGAGYGVVAPYACPSMTSAAPYGVDPMTGIPYSEKSKVVAGLLQIFLGTLGIGRFYKGDIGIGVAQLLCSVFFFWTFLTWVWPLIDGIVLLAGSPRDRNGRPLRS